MTELDRFTSLINRCLPLASHRLPNEDSEVVSEAVCLSLPQPEVLGCPLGQGGISTGEGMLGLAEGVVGCCLGGGR